jgi:hypothetical protein
MYAADVCGILMLTDCCSQGGNLHNAAGQVKVCTSWSCKISSAQTNLPTLQQHMFVFNRTQRA